MMDVCSTIINHIIKPTTNTIQDTSKRRMNIERDSNSSQEVGVIECWGEAKDALERYRLRFQELKVTGQSKPDMVAFKELRNEFTPERRHGELPGVPIGLVLRGRGEAAIVGIHQKILNGIDALHNESCYAVCISGGYADDDDYTGQANGGTIYYTGEGGQDKYGNQVKDQSPTSVGNAALLKSIQTGLTIRVLRGKYPQYYYLGLYRCTGYTYAPGVHGKNVFKFTLVPCIKNQCPRQRSVAIDSKFKWSKLPLPASQPQPLPPPPSSFHRSSSSSLLLSPPTTTSSKVQNTANKAAGMTTKSKFLTPNKKRRPSLGFVDYKRKVAMAKNNKPSPLLLLKPKPHSKKRTSKARLDDILKKKFHT